MLQKFIRKIGYIISKFLIFLFPINKNKITIIEETPFSGSNSYALYIHLKNINKNINKNNKLNIIYLEGKIKSFKEYFNWLKNISSSKIVVVSHGLPFKKKKNQIFIQLWHGIPLKAMGLLDKSANLKEKKLVIKSINQYDYIISSSDTYSTLLNSTVGSYKSKYLNLGFPRIDFLFKKGRLNEIVDFDGKKVVFYIPTYRKGYLDKIEGIERYNNIFGFEDFSLEIFDNFLKDNNILFIAKLHPFEEAYYKKIYKDFKSKNFIFLNQDILKEKKIDLYEILPDSDLLITDYSSIYFDYLILNKPVIFINNDIKTYYEKRGFLLYPYDFWTPGLKVSNFNSMLDSIHKILSGNDDYSTNRKMIRDIFFYYQDPNSSERISNFIIDLLK
ncbi:CDP-glycerol glycerophosphotransferase family protein [Marinitoga sp. 1138]|uniref:CDP-glycerol glycerophosphotransferase family protein n=1 Tax=Marinitoga sp. 1138 TaxID=1643334 RepID=UPI0015866B0B|nr:CDP-glycerol glycerophosphotransferase family protein [Marinitoga sp. 1138]NUU97776.1 hypothetical protein [Marinitoga sp. 1138]